MGSMLAEVGDDKVEDGAARRDGAVRLARRVDLLGGLLGARTDSSVFFEIFFESSSVLISCSSSRMLPTFASSEDCRRVRPVSAIEMTGWSVRSEFRGICVLQP